MTDIYTRAKELYDNEEYDKAFALCNEAEAQGNAQCQCLLGKMYAFGYGVEQDYAKAVEWYRKSAEQGDSEGQRRLGYMYYVGKGIEQNYSVSKKWYELSANSENASAQWQLARIFELGCGVDIDYAEAEKWYRKSAEQGNREGQWRLGALFEFARGRKQDMEVAIEWYRKAALKHDTASWRLGCIYELGKGVNQDLNEALKWYRVSAELGHTPAQLRLGNFYQKGIENVLAPSPKKAVEWWKKAAENKVPDGDAACQLGYAYYDGDGVARDLQEAKKWFQKALELGVSCEPALDMVRSELKETEENQMQQYARQVVGKGRLDISKLHKRVTNDLRQDFGDAWELLQPKSQKFLTTGVMCYVLLYSVGSVNGTVDFSSAITPMFKALELELGKYLYTGYVQYLQENNVPFREFVGKRMFIKKISEYDPMYCDPKDTTEFTLGALPFLFGADRKQMGGGHIEIASDDKRRYKTHSGETVKTVDATMLQYLKTITKEDAFGNVDREREMTDYLFYLSDTVGTLAERFRNPAAHDVVMSRNHAEICGNYLIKVQKMIGKFLEKLKPEVIAPEVENTQP